MNIKLLISFFYFFGSAVILKAASSPLILGISTNKDERSAKWENFKIKHKKDYANPEEEAARRLTFLKVDARIEAHNSSPNVSYKMAHNKLSDLQYEEKKALLGAIKPLNYEKERSTSRTEIMSELDRDIPASLDLRKVTNCIGPVKNQGQCGSCWTFSALAALEFSYCINRGRSYVSLSEQQLVDCDQGNHGCNGGWPDSAWSYIQSAGGSDSTSFYPYRGVREQSCSFSPYKVRARVASHGPVDSDVNSIMKALNKHGVLSVCAQVNDAFYSYSSGVFSDPTCTCTSSSCLMNHAMANVGYGYDNASGKDYWIIRNSWSSGWGNQGYIWIEKGVNMCGIENYVYRVTAQ